MLAFHTVRSGVAIDLELARVVLMVKAKKKVAVRSAEARQGHVQSRKVNKV
jgi:hypothetical protein